MKVDIILSNFLGITPAGMTVHSKDNISHLFDIHWRSFLDTDFSIHLDSPHFSSWFEGIYKTVWRYDIFVHFCLVYTLDIFGILKFPQLYTDGLYKNYYIHTHRLLIKEWVVSPNLWHDFSQCKLKHLCIICIDPQYHCTRPHQINLRSEQVAPGSVVSQNWPPCSSSSADVATAGYHESGKWLNRFI